VVYRTCLDPVLLALWRVPETMTAHVHAFDAREGGTFRMSLTYQDAGSSSGGKTTHDTDTFRGRFARLVPDERIVEVIAFESNDSRYAGEMTMTTSFADSSEGTFVTIRYQNIPSGIRPEDNEIGCRSSLAKLAALLERR